MEANGTRERARLAAQRAAQARRRLGELDERLASLRQQREATTTGRRPAQDRLRDPAAEDGRVVRATARIADDDVRSAADDDPLARLAAVVALPRPDEDGAAGPGDDSSRHTSFDAARALAGLTHEQAWQAYASLDGSLDLLEVEAHLHGLTSWPRHQQDVLAQALNEALEDAGMGRPLPYWGFDNPHAVTAKLWEQLRPPGAPPRTRGADD